MIVGTPIGVFTWASGALAVKRCVTLAIELEDTVRVVTLQVMVTVNDQELFVTVVLIVSVAMIVTV